MPIVPDCHCDHRRLRLLGGRRGLEAGGGQTSLVLPQAADEQIQPNGHEEEEASGPSGTAVPPMAFELDKEVGGREEAHEAEPHGRKIYNDRRERGGPKMICWRAPDDTLTRGQISRMPGSDSDSDSVSGWGGWDFVETQSYLTL